MNPNETGQPMNIAATILKVTITGFSISPLTALHNPDISDTRKNIHADLPQLPLMDSEARDLIWELVFIIRRILVNCIAKLIVWGTNAIPFGEKGVAC